MALRASETRCCGGTRLFWGCSLPPRHHPGVPTPSERKQRLPEVREWWTVGSTAPSPFLVPSTPALPAAGVCNRHTHRKALPAAGPSEHLGGPWSCTLAVPGDLSMCGVLQGLTVSDGAPSSCPSARNQATGAGRTRHYSGRAGASPPTPCGLHHPPPTDVEIGTQRVCHGQKWLSDGGPGV